MEPPPNEAENMDSIQYQDENEHSTDKENESDDPNTRLATLSNYFDHNGLRTDGDI